MWPVLRLKLCSVLFWLLNWDAIIRVTLEQTLIWAPKSVFVHQMHRVGRVFFFFFNLLALFYLDGSDCMTSVCSFVWKWSPVHCTVTGLFVFVWKKRLEQKHSDSEQTLVHRQAMIQESVDLILCLCNVPLELIGHSSHHCLCFTEMLLSFSLVLWCSMVLKYLDIVSVSPFVASDIYGGIFLRLLNISTVIFHPKIWRNKQINHKDNK